MRPSLHTGHLNWSHSGISRLKFFNLVEYFAATGSWLAGERSN
jgi:hypothetical protein